MRLARLLCGCLRYLTHFLRFDNVLPVWRALYKLSSLHAARKGTALQVSIHPRAKTARQRRRETLAKQRLERLQHIRDAKMRHLALKEEALKYQREMADAAQEEQQRQQQEQIDRFRSLVQMERRRKLLEDARKRQNEVGAKQRKIEEEVWSQICAVASFFWMANSNSTFVHP
jgi:mannose-6-phosphate isomerase class I